MTYHTETGQGELGFYGSLPSTCQQVISLSSISNVSKWSYASYMIKHGLLRLSMPKQVSRCKTICKVVLGRTLKKRNLALSLSRLAFNMQSTLKVSATKWLTDRWVKISLRFLELKPWSVVSPVPRWSCVVPGQVWDSRQFQVHWHKD